MTVTPFRQADQLKGLSLGQSRLALPDLAALHASTWKGRGMDTRHRQKNGLDEVLMPLRLPQRGVGLGIDTRRKWCTIAAIYKCCHL